MPALREYSQSGCLDTAKIQNVIKEVDKSNLQYATRDIETIEPASARLEKLLGLLNNELLAPHNFFIWEGKDYNFSPLENIKICFTTSREEYKILNRPVMVHMGFPIYESDKTKEMSGIAKIDEGSILLNLEAINLKCQDPWKSRSFSGIEEHRSFFDAIWGLNDAIRDKYTNPKELLGESIKSTLIEEMQHIRDMQRVIDWVLEMDKTKGTKTNPSHIVMHPTIAHLLTQRNSFLQSKFLDSIQKPHIFQSLFSTAPTSYKGKVPWIAANVANGIVESSANLAQCAISDPKLSIVKWLNYIGQFNKNSPYGMMGAWNLYMLRTALNGHLGNRNFLIDPSTGLMDFRAYAEIGSEVRTMNSEDINVCAEKLFNYEFVDKLNRELFSQAI